MVTYDELFQFGLLIVAVVSLVYKISHKKYTPRPMDAVIF